MLQCGFVRLNFSLAIGVLRGAARRLERVAGIEPASSAWKAAALPLCYTRREARGALFSPSFQAVVGEAGLEPAKAYASGFTVRPLCRSGHSPQRARSLSGPGEKPPQTGAAGAISARPQGPNRRRPVV